VDFFIRRHNSCLYLPLRGSNDRAVKSAKVSERSIAVLAMTINFSVTWPKKIEMSNLSNNERAG
jgi:hypothetical protein